MPLPKQINNPQIAILGNMQKRNFKNAVIPSWLISRVYLAVLEEAVPTHFRNPFWQENCGSFTCPTRSKQIANAANFAGQTVGVCCEVGYLQ